MYETLEFKNRLDFKSLTEWLLLLDRSHQSIKQSFEQSWRCVPLSVCLTSQTLDHFVQYVNCSWRYPLFEA